MEPKGSPNMENAAFEHLLLTSMANRASRKNTKRFKSGRFVTFVLGVLIAIFMVNAEVHAMSLGAPLPNGVGFFGVKIPLSGKQANPGSAEFHMFALYNRSKMMRIEAPVHGRFVRFKLARMKYIMRLANKSGNSSAYSSRASARVSPSARPVTQYRSASFSLADMAGNSVAVAPPEHYSRRDQVTASGVIMSEFNPERRSTRTASPTQKRNKISKSAARRMAMDFARRYAIMREKYIRLRAQSPEAGT